MHGIKVGGRCLDLGEVWLQQDGAYDRTTVLPSAIHFYRDAQKVYKNRQKNMETLKVAIVEKIAAVLRENMERVMDDFRLPHTSTFPLIICLISFCVCK